MNKKPTALIPHISIFGKRNVGKSSLLNALAGQEVALVSEILGTTTDPVKKRMELIPYGPVIFIDTAGLDDSGELGLKRVEKTEKVMMQTDLALIVSDCVDVDDDFIQSLTTKLRKRQINYILIMNKSDLIDQAKKQEINNQYPEVIFVSTIEKNVEKLRSMIIDCLGNVKEPSIIGSKLQYGDVAILVIPIDAEAPKGRIILPQVQVIRDLLDHGIHTHVVRETELEAAIDLFKKVDIVITDSQAFEFVDKVVPKDINLTSFSMLFADYKGDFKTLIQGARHVESLTEKSKILVVESCSHNISHDDIGTIKIPKLLENHLGFKPRIDHVLGHDFPKMIEGYDLIVHCGSCMLNRKTMQQRILAAKEQKIEMVNYGVLISYLTHTLDRTSQIFNV